MNAAQLLTHYEKIADVSYAIERLRRFILDLAVRGKLVSQDPKDEPASELLGRMAKEKLQLLGAGFIGPQKSLPPISADDETFVLPNGWAWVRLGNLSEFVTSGSRDWAKYYSEEGAIFLRMGNLSKDHYRLRLHQVQRVKPPADGEGTRTRLEAGDILISITGDVGMLGLIPQGFGEAYVNQHTAMVRPMRDMKGSYLAELFRSPFAQVQFNGPQRGIKNSFRLTDVTQFIVPLPPLAEQHRIVAKVDELMALCDQLEKSRTTREKTRDRLTAASLARLNDPDPETFQDDARFALNALPSITTRPDQIKQLRQTILSLAVRGKLVPQDPKEDRPISFDETIPPELERPFKIPSSWKWARLHTLGRLKGGGTPSKTRDDFWNGSIPWVSPKDMKVDYIAAAQLGITEAAIAGSAAALVDTGSILFVVRGMILAHSFPVAVTQVPLAINQDMKALVLSRPEMGEFILRTLKGMKPEVLKRVQRSTHGTCRLEGSDYSELLLPIPAPAEQRRIVAKLDELMAICDRLEATLTTGETVRSRLLDALLSEALEPLVEQLEAAA